MTSKDSALYGFQRPKNLHGKKEISSSQSLSFTSHLSSLINTKPPTTANNTGTSTSRKRLKKDDIFTTHNRNAHKRAKRDLEQDDDSISNPFTQKHTTNGEGLDSALWERSKRKMQEKARLYAAMKRGDLEDEDEKYAVDFDQKWAATHPEGTADESEDESSEDERDAEIVEYTDEFGRARTGTRSEALRAERSKRNETSATSDRFTARPSAPANIIRGDTIQHSAFDPDAPIAEQMASLAAKRDKSLTPPPEQHFDARQEVRQKGTGFFQFSEDAEERKRQMENLAQERVETERRRAEREAKVKARMEDVEARRKEVLARKDRRKADDFLNELGAELGGAQGTESVEPAAQEESGDDESEDEVGPQPPSTKADPMAMLEAGWQSPPAEPGTGKQDRLDPMAMLEAASSQRQ